MGQYCHNRFADYTTATLTMPCPTSSSSSSSSCGSGCGLKMQVVYYLSRGGEVEHPHLLQVPLPPSSQALHLRDVVQKLTSVRGKGMSSLFSWSYKRRYKNGYVWQDISEDDVIYPAAGGEYILKGSQITAYANDEKSGLKGHAKVANNNIPPRCANNYIITAKPRDLIMHPDEPKNIDDNAFNQRQAICKEEFSFQSCRNSYIKQGTIHIANNRKSPVNIDNSTDTGLQTEEEEEEEEERKEEIDHKQERICENYINASIKRQINRSPVNSPITLDSVRAKQSSNRASSSTSEDGRKQRNNSASAKHLYSCSSSSGIFQILSCGGMDIKEDNIIPLSLYLRENGQQKQKQKQSGVNYRNNRLFDGSSNFCDASRYLGLADKKKSKKSSFIDDELHHHSKPRLKSAPEIIKTIASESYSVKGRKKSNHFSEKAATQTETALQQAEEIINVMESCYSGSDR